MSSPLRDRSRLRVRVGPGIGACVVALVMLAAVAPHHARGQDTGSTQRKLNQAKRELRDVASQRREIESQRGDATRKLRAVDEQVGQSTRALNRTQLQLRRQQAELDQLQRQRDALASSLRTQRDELARLLRAAYAVGGDAPLKLLLSQDSVVQGNRVLTYHGYLQRDRARRIAQLQAELAGLTALEQRVRQARRTLDLTGKQHQIQLTRLAADREQRSQAVATLDQQVEDTRGRERALGRDVKGLETVLAQLRAAARKAQAERRAAAARAAREERAAARRNRADDGGGRSPRPQPAVVANAAPIQVGGLGWPVSGTLVAAYGGSLPDGRRSTGLLIGAAAGTPVRAVANGKVVFAEWMSGYGLICIVDHGNGYMSLYANNDGLLKDVGADVKRGDTVATVGNSGGQGSTGLYFELRRGGAPVDPRAWLQKR